jgi:hypothetical protein
MRRAEFKHKANKLFGRTVTHGARTLARWGSLGPN